MPIFQKAGRHSSLILLMCLFLFGSASAAIKYVNPAAVGANNGTSWVNAFTSLSNALATASSGDEIWVKQGVYKPTIIVDVNGSGGSDPREATFFIPVGVALYGGFTGAEATRDARNAVLNVTILSGDIDNNDLNADGNSIAENTSDVVGNNAYHTVLTIQANSSTRLDGFTITAGRAASAAIITDDNQNGGGWYNRIAGNVGSPTIINCNFIGNYASSQGGAFYTTSGGAGAVMQSLIENCLFKGNKSNVSGGAIHLGSFTAGNYQPQIKKCRFIMNEAFRRGGAIYLVGDHAMIDSCFFQANKVTAISMNGTLPGSGGAASMVGSNASFRFCIFEANTTTGNPTGPFEGGGGGAVYMSTNEIQTNTLGISSPKFVSCGFFSNIANGNTAAWGGAAVHLSDGGKLRPSYVNCVFFSNQAQDHGGAVANFARVISAAGGYVPELKPAFTNCTFTLNHAAKLGGAIYNDGFEYMGAEVLDAKVENSILWNNTATTSGSEIYLTGIARFRYSLIQNSGGSGGSWNSAIGTDEGNNISGNPGFVNPGDAYGADDLPATADDGLKLSASSPAVNHGNNSAVGLVGITTDFNANSRLIGTVDMGAYERSGIVVPPFDITWLRDWAPVRPVCLVCPWSFVFTDAIFDQFIWDGPAQLIQQDGSATITGNIVNRTNKKMGFVVNIKLVNKQDWQSWNAKGRTYFAITLESIRAAKANYKNWSFWELSEDSYLQGTGDLSGRVSIQQIPKNFQIGFQLGIGANGWDDDNGMSGKFSYNGTLLHKGVKKKVNGIATMNVDAEPCTAKCEPIINAVAFAAANMPVQSDRLVSEENKFSVYPVPARSQLTIALGSAVSGQYQVNFLNNQGILLRRESVIATHGKLVTSVTGLKPGNYVLQIISADGTLGQQKIVVN